MGDYLPFGIDFDRSLLDFDRSQESKRQSEATFRLIGMVPLAAMVS